MTRKNVFTFALALSAALIGTMREPGQTGVGRSYFEQVFKLWTEADSEAELAASLKAHNLIVTTTYEERAEILFQTDPDTVRAVFENRSINGYDYVEDLKKLTCPTLFVRADPSLWSAMGEPDINHVKTLVADLTYVDMPGAGHNVFSDQPAIFCQHVLKFL